MTRIQPGKGLEINRLNDPTVEINRNQRFKWPELGLSFIQRLSHLNGRFQDI